MSSQVKNTKIVITGGQIANVNGGGSASEKISVGTEAAQQYSPCIVNNAQIDIKGGTVVGLFTGTNGGTVIAANSDFLKLFYKTDSVGNKEIITNSFGISAKAYVSENTIKEELTQPITVGKDVFNALSTTGASYIVSMPKYSWEISGKNITNSNIDVDLQINITKNAPDTIKFDVEELISDGTEVLFLNFSHHGQLPGKVKIQIEVSELYSNGTKLYIAHYNETTKKLEDSKEVVVENGKITFEITSCSSYILSKVNLMAVKEEVKKEPEKTVKMNSEKKIEKDTTPKTGINDNMKIPMIIISLAVLGLVAVGSRKRK